MDGKNVRQIWGGGGGALGHSVDGKEVIQIWGGGGITP